MEHKLLSPSFITIHGLGRLPRVWPRPLGGPRDGRGGGILIPVARNTVPEEVCEKEIVWLSHVQKDTIELGLLSTAANNSSFWKTQSKCVEQYYIFFHYITIYICSRNQKQFARVIAKAAHTCCHVWWETNLEFEVLFETKSVLKKHL